MKTREELLKQVFCSIDKNETAMCMISDEKTVGVYFAGDPDGLADAIQKYVIENINKPKVKEVVQAILFGTAYAVTTNEDVLDCFNSAVKFIEEEGAKEEEEEEDIFDPDDEVCLSCSDYGNCLKKFVEEHKEMHTDAVKKEDNPEEDED